MIATSRLGTPGARPALLAHCYLGHAGSWRGLMAALRTPLDALAFDMPGHGHSPLSAQPVDFHAEIAALMPGLLAQVAPDGQPALIIGHSFGAASALRHALYHPASVAGLVLIEPIFYAAAREEPEYPVRMAAEAPIHQAIAAGRMDDAAALFLELNGDGTPFDRMPEPVRALLKRQIAMMPSSDAGLIDDSGGLLVPGRMEGFAKPVLLLAGSESAPICRAILRGLANRLPGAGVEIVSGAGHMLPITHADDVARRIEAWLAATDS